jgi:hypothetical protein
VSLYDKLRTNPNGKPGTAPCGHPGTHVIGTYVKCDVGCDDVTAGEGEESDGIPVYIDPDSDRTQPICPFIGCPGGQIKKWGPEFSQHGKDMWQCTGCCRSFLA